MQTVDVVKFKIKEPIVSKQRFDQNAIARMCTLRRYGYTLSEIAKIFGTSKSAIHYHVRNVKINTRGKLRLEKLLKEIVERARVLSAETRRKIARSKLKESYTKMSPEKARVLAHSLFDGCVGKREVRYFNKNRVLIQKFLKDMKAVYGLEPNSQTVKNGVTTVEFYNLALADDLLLYTPSYSTGNPSAKVPTAIVASRNPVITQEFLRAFWDDEGTVGFYPRVSRFYLRGRCKSENVRKNLIRLHQKLGIVAIEKPSGVIIQDLNSLKKFLKEVGFTPGVKVCGGNGVYPPRWKGFEKNNLLGNMVKYLHSHTRAKNK